MDISQIGALPTSTAKLTNGGTVSTGEKSLGMDDFFQLLAAELQYQDPTNPTSNDQFMQEMAQYSTLEAIQNLVKVSNYTVASNLAGKNVSYNQITVDNDNHYTTQKITGTVEAVDFSFDKPKCYVVNTVDGKATGEWVNYSEIQQVYASDVTTGTSSSGSSSGGTATA